MEGQNTGKRHHPAGCSISSRVSLRNRAPALEKSAELELTVWSKARICLVSGLAVSLSPKPQNADNDLFLKGSALCA